MGRSTVTELIARGKNQNDYNNTGIDTDGKWVDYFNDALQDLVSDINLTGTLQVSFVNGTREYNLPADFFELTELWDGFGCLVPKRRFYDQIYGSFYNTPQGYYIRFEGSGYTIDLYQYNSNQTFNGIYNRYPAKLSESVLTANPEVPTVGENALTYYAISKSLRANNQPGQAIAMEQKYEQERKKIRDAAARALVGGW